MQTMRYCRKCETTDYIYDGYCRLCGDMATGSLALGGGRSAPSQTRRAMTDRYNCRHGSGTGRCPACGEGPEKGPKVQEEFSCRVQDCYIEGSIYGPRDRVERVRGALEKALSLLASEASQRPIPKALEGEPTPTRRILESS